MKMFIKFYLVSAFICFGFISAFAAELPKVETYKLNNGLTVYLNSDQTVPNVFGAVVVRAGSNNEKYDATGLAHYFEHIMFKGTDKIGTLNWEKEKIYLDSIKDLYDTLFITKNEQKRMDIQKKINKLNIKASEYAIPNEVDKLLKFFGGTRVNAYTSFDRTVYHNYFPANQLESWMDIYSERFRNPVFRLFQSELETVYEEKNMYNDNPFTQFMDSVFSRVFKGHPMGHHNVIGLTEHLKNPRLSKMYDFFNTYYVANNMALIVCGNFDVEKTKLLISQKFEQWPTRDLPETKMPKAWEFKGREFMELRMLPIKVGLMAYRGVPLNHPDYQALSFANQILSNQNSTGLFDNLRMDNKIMSGQAIYIAMPDVSANLVLFIPKIVGQKLPDAEELVLGEIKKLKAGQFSDDLFQAIKLEARRRSILELESPDKRARMMIDAFVEGVSWQSKMEELKQIESLTKEQVVKAANIYFGENRMVVYSKTGFPKKEKLAKPPYDPVIPKNTELDSEFAKNLKLVKDTIVLPKLIEFGKDVLVKDLAEKVHLFYTLNPVNEIFTLNLKYGLGYYNYPALKQAAGYLGLIGTTDADFKEFRTQLQKIGATFSISTSNDEFIISITGFDSYFSETLSLINKLVHQPKADEKQLEKFMEDAKMSYKIEVKDPETLGNALQDYALYGEKSWYLNRLSMKEIKKLKSDDLLAAIKKAISHEMEFQYCGSLNPDTLEMKIKTSFTFPENPLKSTSPLYQERKKISENMVLLVDDPKAIQSKIYMMRDGEVNQEDEITLSQAFNNYFGSGMSSLIFQEVREFRSLGYAAYGSYQANRMHRDKPGYLIVYVGTQADKTNEAVDILYSLTNAMPLKPDRMEQIKKSLMQSMDANYNGFRSIPNMASNFVKMGYSNDPRMKYFEIYRDTKFEDIVEFYKKNVNNHATLITILGNKKKMDMKGLEKYGTIKKISVSTIIRK